MKHHGYYRRLASALASSLKGLRFFGVVVAAGLAAQIYLQHSARTRAKHQTQRQRNLEWVGGGVLVRRRCSDAAVPPALGAALLAPLAAAHALAARAWSK